MSLTTIEAARAALKNDVLLGVSEENGYGLTVHHVGDGWVHFTELQDGQFPFAALMDGPWEPLEELGDEGRYHGDLFFDIVLGCRDLTKPNRRRPELSKQLRLLWTSVLTRLARTPRLLQDNSLAVSVGKWEPEPGVDPLHAVGSLRVSLRYVHDAIPIVTF